mmetsp:Transcript_7921/g.24749  ORF Transcript_7921/g.24749 Transcript_7921/m.24749 type:complete len:253 (+) Transcript_7921:88-846(+)
MLTRPRNVLLLCDGQHVFHLGDVVLDEVLDAVLQRHVGLGASRARAVHPHVDGAIYGVKAIELDVPTVLLHKGPHALLQELHDLRLERPGLWRGPRGGLVALHDTVPDSLEASRVELADHKLHVGLDHAPLQAGLLCDGDVARGQEHLADALHLEDGSGQWRVICVVLIAERLGLCAVAQHGPLVGVKHNRVRVRCGLGNHRNATPPGRRGPRPSRQGGVQPLRRQARGHGGQGLLQKFRPGGRAAAVPCDA